MLEYLLKSTCWIGFGGPRGFQICHNQRLCSRALYEIKFMNDWCHRPRLNYGNDSMYDFWNEWWDSILHIAWIPLSVGLLSREWECSHWTYGHKTCCVSLHIAKLFHHCNFSSSLDVTTCYHLTHKNPCTWTHRLSTMGYVSSVYIDWKSLFFDTVAIAWWKCSSTTNSSIYGSLKMPAKYCWVKLLSLYGMVRLQKEVQWIMRMAVLKAFCSS